MKPIFSIIIATLVWGCSKTISGTVSCSGINTYTSSYGLINNLHGTLGDVFFINPKEKFMGYMLHEVPDSSYILRDSSVSSFTLNAKIDLDANLDAQSSFKAQLEQMIERNTQLRLSNAYRVRLNSPYHFLQKIEEKHANIFAKIHADSLQYMVITSEVFADSLSLNINNQSASTAAVQTLKIEGVTFKLTNNCDALEALKGHRTSVFFKAIIFDFDKKTGKITPSSKIFDPAKYQLNILNQ
jgi:hypothetical protein